MSKTGRANQFLNIAQTMSILALIALVSVVLHLANGIQGNARVVNYAGMVRGATQRLVKLEIANRPNDPLITRLDAIIANLKTGEGAFQLNRLEDKDYQDSLARQTVMWEHLKQQIMAARSDHALFPGLVDLSEQYFDLANNTAQIAERYSERMAASLHGIQVALAADALLILSFLAYKTAAALALRRKNVLLKDMAEVDENTGLPNKGRCDRLLAETGELRGGTRHACIMFDLNNLKAVNDSLGHKAGDELILSFARILRGTTPDSVFVGRYGGDEFIAVLRGTNKEQVQALLREIDAQVAAFNGKKNGIAIDYAVGYGISGTKPCTLRDLLNQADTNMYQDKARKKSQRAGR